MGHMTRSALPSALAAIVALSASGCALPGAIEGIFADKPFELVDERPDGKAQGETELLLVLMEIRHERMSTVSVHLRDVESLPVGEEIAVGDGAWGDARPSFDVVEGTLLRELRSDGVEILSTGDDAVRASSVEGSLTLEEAPGGDLLGRFRVDLDDGGYLDGSFHHPG